MFDFFFFQEKTGKQLQLHIGSERLLLLFIRVCVVCQLLNPARLCDPMGCSLPGSSVHGDSPGKNTGVGCNALLQGDLPNPGIELRSPSLKADSLLSESKGLYQESPRILKQIAYPFSRGIFLTQESNLGLPHFRWILYQLNYKGNPYQSLDK